MRMLLIENLALLLTVIGALAVVRIYDLWNTSSALPEQVAGALAKTFPQASIVSVWDESAEGGRNVYDVLLAEGGRQLSVEIAHDGTLLEFERRANLSEAPAAVERTIQRRLRRCRVERIDAVALSRAKFYEVHLQGVGVPLFLDEAGRVIAKPGRLQAAA